MKLITLNGEGTITLSLMLIKNAEGFSDVPYQDSLGNWTIGYGFNMSEPEYSGITHIDEVEADSLLKVRIVEIYNNEKNAYHLFSFTYSHVINATLIDMSYNLGIAGLESFDNFLQYIKCGLNEEAVADLTNTLWYSQVKERAVRNCLNLLLENKQYLYLM